MRMIGIKWRIGQEKILLLMRVKKHDEENLFLKKERQINGLDWEKRVKITISDFVSRQCYSLSRSVNFL